MDELLTAANSTPHLKKLFSEISSICIVYYEVVFLMKR